jgi:TRAP-type mannitol/chloroaromatic compound transport system permease small subunit
LVTCRAGLKETIDLFSRLCTTTAAIADTINDFTGRSVAWLTLLMVIITCVIVVARYAFNFGSIGLQESVMYMHGVVFMLGIGFTLKERGHVRVDVLHEKFSERTRTYIDMFGHLFFLMPLSVFILWTSIDYVSFSWSLKESSGQPGGLPGVYILKLLIPLMAILLLLQGVSEFLKGLVRLISRQV